MENMVRLGGWQTKGRGVPSCQSQSWTERVRGAMEAVSELDETVLDIKQHEFLQGSLGKTLQVF